MEYKIVKTQSVWSVDKAIESLVQAVNEQVGLGWEPLGGISLTDHGVAVQALLKRD